MDILVAKTYQGLTVFQEPYEKNKKMYCKVRMNSGSDKEVRVYSQKEYDKMYPAPAPKWKPQREMLGFGEDGFILVFNNAPEFEELYERECFRFHKIFGWYLPGNEIVPALLPGIVPKVLSWEVVGRDDGELIEETALVKAFNKFIKTI